MEFPRAGGVPTLSELFLSEEPDLRSPAIDRGVQKKAQRRNPNRQLDSWERYRALNDAMDEAYEMMDHGNREARFALLVMGILNAIVLIGASRQEVVSAFDGSQRLGAGILLGVYAVTAIYFLFQAIAALRPNQFRPDLKAWNEERADYPRGVRYHEDVIERDVHSHWLAWSQVPIAGLNAELAVQHHSLCMKSNVKRIALARLFAGLRVMTMLVVGLMALFVYAAWM